MFSNNNLSPVQLLIFTLSISILASCSVSRQIQKSASNLLLTDSVLATSHVGISVYETGSDRYLFNHQGDKYFVPASNTKIFTTYAALKYLGDSLEAFRYVDLDTAVLIIPTGDPTLLHYDFKNQPGADFLKQAGKPLLIANSNWEDDALGSGWAWNDYNDYYMAERSPFPIYGNVIRWIQERTGDAPTDVTEFDRSVSIYSIPDVSWDVRFDPAANSRSFSVKRNQLSNSFIIAQGIERKRELEVPFITNGVHSSIELMKDTISENVGIYPGAIPVAGHRSIKSQPIDSLLKPLMYRSDNFFAEQTLLMVSQRLLNRMNDAAVIDTLMKSDLADLPQRPRWADGSGLSRYNLFTPQSIIAMLGKMRNEFGLDRIKGIFPTGGTGTLSNFYKKDSGYIYAKTGTLGGVVALSGYLITKKNKLLIFSVLVNNHRGNAVEIRRKVESFLTEIRNRF